jgi:translation initiation factor IF-1
MRDTRETKEQSIEVEGVVALVLPGTMFRVKLDNDHMVLATICGKMRKRWVRLTAGDRVIVSGLQRAQPGQPVKAVPADAKANVEAKTPAAPAKG